MRLTMPRLSPWKLLLSFIFFAGAYATVIRFGRGLGASTNLNDQFPWGLWVGFDVLCGVMLAAGGFTIMAVVHIFNIERFKPVTRPTLLTAFLGYVLVVIGLLYDLGLSYRIWHPMAMWNPRSVMFEVAWCVMLYTTVLALEFAPIVFERFRIVRALRILRAISMPLVILGVLLSTLHQSSLGSLYLIVPHKLYALWYSPLLPVFFFISAIGIGLAMTIIESDLSSRFFHRRLELPLLREMGRILAVVLAVYSTIRFLDLFHRQALGRLLEARMETWFFLAEVGIGLVLPMVLLFTPRVRAREGGLLLAASSVVVGFIINRLNVSIVGMTAFSGVTYIPKWTELAVTLSIIAAGVTLFGLAVKHLPIFPAAEPEAASTPVPAPAETPAALSRVTS